ncbi:MAG: FMN-binding protein [Spirochaetaceae bacterium]|jgi:major membrane immunogen (membrane-anchored lipoprotein)|nr:FMN-binding protein [Spirochaetaceae bacterium]
MKKLKRVRLLVKEDEMRKYILIFWAVLALAAAFSQASCKKASYKDGIYHGKSSADDSGAWGEVTVTISNGRVSACDFVCLQKDGTVKGEDYGKVNGEISNRVFYEKAQLAVLAMKQYADSYVRLGEAEKVEAVSGATVAYNQFLESVEAALSQAK